MLSRMKSLARILSNQGQEMRIEKETMAGPLSFMNLADIFHFPLRAVGSTLRDRVEPEAGTHYSLAQT